ncbi:hypothetical protein BZA05DRAFT_474816 [Tricharina praecox]|uniref:uncharacterized protein n=1 Tax=Tricharina praecox TaxID=43433 RepID=UPI0022209618|nr:uncharacterized protein BZA05DRAFT_474816 [Tricharina praecox]KAI5849800.1 hypothetical protein BZA05DRAFT_474816 [Tricharina praecox]
MARTIGSADYDLLQKIPIDHSQLDMDIRPLTSELFTFHSSSPGGGYYALHELCDYGTMRYHILITCSDETASCIEKTLLLECKASMSRDLNDDGREDAIWRAWRDLEHLWHPVVKADYLSQMRQMTSGATTPNLIARRGSPFPHGRKKTLVKLHVFTVDGTIATKEHLETLRWPRYDPLPNTWPSLAVFGPTHVTLGPLVHGRLGNLVIAGGSRYLFKSLQGFFDTQYFIRLVDNLVKLQGSPRFPVLAGLAESEEGDGRIDGLLREYVEGEFLDAIDPTEKDRATRQKWKRQIVEAAEITQRVGVAWSDACVSDIFIRRDADGAENALVCGVGSRILHTMGSGRLLEPEIGEVRGLEEIMNYIDDINGAN